MSKANPLISTLVLLAATGMPAIVSASDHQGLYRFGSLGVATVEAEASAAGARVERNGTAPSLRAGIGYRWSRHVAVEAPAPPPLGKVNLGSLGGVRSYGTQGSVLGIVPLGDSFELFGKLSAGIERNRWSEGVRKPYTVRMNHMHLGLGLGARYRITNAMAVRLDVDSLSQGSYHAGPVRGELSLGSATLGLQYQF
ncbi:hypothetical protein G6F22_014540 [Rhizopus arrhizus]|nr:hypothetical protein G6F22_014540 [Rhizopus arrhizus]